MTALHYMVVYCIHYIAFHFISSHRIALRSLHRTASHCITVYCKYASCIQHAPCMLCSWVPIRMNRRCLVAVPAGRVYLLPGRHSLQYSSPYQETAATAALCATGCHDTITVVVIRTSNGQSVQFKHPKLHEKVFAWDRCQAFSQESTTGGDGC